MCPTRFLLSRIPSSGMPRVAPRCGTPQVISATELVQIAAPARFTGFSTFSGSLGSAKIFSRGASESRGASNGRTSGQLFLAASRAQLPTQRALDSPIYGLSSAPSRGSWARNGAQAEHRTCHGLAPVATALGLHCRGRGSFHKTTHNRSGIRSVCMATPHARRGG